MDKVYLEEQGLKIVCPVDCGNAPKKRILRELLTAFAVKDIPTLNKYLAQDVSWEIINKMTIQGLEEVVKELENRNTLKIIEIEILHIITHGKTASANGNIKYEDDKNLAFCHVYEFVSAGKNKIKEITSYIINID